MFYAVACFGGWRREATAVNDVSCILRSQNSTNARALNGRHARLVINSRVVDVFCLATDDMTPARVEGLKRPREGKRPGPVTLSSPESVINVPYIGARSTACETRCRRNPRRNENLIFSINLVERRRCRWCESLAHGGATTPHVVTEACGYLLDPLDVQIVYDACLPCEKKYGSRSSDAVVIAWCRWKRRPDHPRRRRRSVGALICERAFTAGGSSRSKWNSWLEVRIRVCRCSFESGFRNEAIAETFGLPVAASEDRRPYMGFVAERLTVGVLTTDSGEKLLQDSQLRRYFRIRFYVGAVPCRVIVMFRSAQVHHAWTWGASPPRHSEWIARSDEVGMQCHA